MNFYKRHIGDYIKDAGHLTLLEHGIYTRLLDVYYTREAGIPQDKAARLIGARSKDEVQALTNVLDEFFTLADNIWTQGRCEEEIGNASAKADKNRENGAKGGRPRKTLPDSQPTENPNGFDFENHVGSKNNLSQTPDSRLQKNDNDDSTDSGSASSSADDPDLPPGAGAPLPPLEPAESPTDPAVVIAVALRKLHVNANSMHPAVIDWATRGVTIAKLAEAVAIARDSKPTGTIPPNYLVGIVNDLLNPPAAAPGHSAPRPPAQPRKPTGTDPKGIDESYDAYNARITKAEADRRKGQP
ncbi:MAG: YdaU family protein [Pseudomonadota bacterium]